MFVISVIAMILILIGALNWGLVGFFNYNFISVIFGGAAEGDYSGFDRFVFAIIGLAGIWGLSFLGRLGALSSFSQKKEDESIKGDFTDTPSEKPEETQKPEEKDSESDENKEDR